MAATDAKDYQNFIRIMSFLTLQVEVAQPGKAPAC